MMALRHTYFSASGFNPVPWLDRRLNPYRHQASAVIRDRTVQIHWTERAAAALNERTRPLYVEMQVYFSCIVKKRVLFHADAATEAFTEATQQLRVRASAVESDICTPEAFAAHYPARRELTTPAAGRMVPHHLWLDYQHGEWVGSMRL
jgi:hypothetical protein